MNNSVVQITRCVRGLSETKSWEKKERLFFCIHFFTNSVTNTFAQRKEELKIGIQSPHSTKVTSLFAGEEVGGGG